MKKNYFMLAAATMMLAACAETDLVNEIAVEETPQAIGFETFAQKATRVTNATTGLATHHEQYYVWAYKSTNDQLVFDAEEVNAANNSYGDDIKYWDKAATNYYFYASAPSAFTFVGTSKNAAYFTLSNVELKCTNFTTGLSADATEALKANNSDIDYMIAETDVPTNENAFYDPVNFNFKHILSRLNITITKEANHTANIVLNSVTVNGLKTKATTFDSSLEDLNRWVTDQTTVQYTSIDGTVTTTAQYVLECLLIPQAVSYEEVALAGEDSYSHPYICVDYKIENGTDQSGQPTYEEFKAFYNLAALFGAEETDNQNTTEDETMVTFSEACQSTLNITFNPTGIVFSTTTTNWTAENANGGNQTID